MRYIGSKLNLLSEIEAQIPKGLGPNSVFCDVFSGTAAVGHYFKRRFTVVSNDQLYFSFVLQKARIELNERPHFGALVRKIGEDPIEYLNSDQLDNWELLSNPICLTEFSPGGGNGRQYLTESNALRIDQIRQVIEYWLKQEMILESEYYYLLASLINAIPSVSNIAGTYGAYLKHWDPRTAKRLKLLELATCNNGRVNRAFNSDASELLATISGDVLYVDPPYNSRQYISNYHLLETVARYDYPELVGKSGVRRDPTLSSKFCKSREAASEFDLLLSRASFRHLVLSYSSEGLLAEEQLVDIIKKHFELVTIARIPYRRYARVSNPSKATVHELLLVGTK